MNDRFAWHLREFEFLFCPFRKVLQSHFDNLAFIVSQMLTDCLFWARDKEITFIEACEGELECVSD